MKDPGTLNTSKTPQKEGKFNIQGIQTHPNRPPQSGKSLGYIRMVNSTALVSFEGSINLVREQGDLY